VRTRELGRVSGWRRASGGRRGRVIKIHFEKSHTMEVNGVNEPLLGDSEYGGKDRVKLRYFLFI
jgi:hypothetical protein